ncbi:MAG: response regulator [Myxococcota bacterium]|nr:response regulator [Myxococcota bacterium]
MSTSEATQDRIHRRLEAMGIEVTPMPGRRCLVGRMRLQKSTFETTTNPIRIEEVTFATVGANSAKCLKPRALFQLPILPIRDCRDAIAIEARIHLAWQRHIAQLADTEAWLRQIGTEFQSEEDRSLVAFSIAGEDPEARARMIDPNRVILPGRGLLGSIALQRAEDRILGVDRRIQSSVDLEINVSNRLEVLARLDSRLSRQMRVDALEEEPLGEPQACKERSPAVLVVGPEAIRNSAFLESLRLRGYDVTAARGEREAIASFDRCSPELLFADVLLGRSEGIDLIHSMRQVPGIEEVPVILMDASENEDHRQAARSMGAAGYLTYPIDVSRIAERLSKMVSEPRRRRFSRYPQRVAVKLGGSQEPLLTTTIGRGGMFLATAAEDLATHEMHDCELALPEIDASVRVEAEVLYRNPLGQNAGPGVALRFHAFRDRDEALFIEYLGKLHP